MAVGIGMRTIWVALRAVNYSKPAFTAAESSVKSLSAWQERFMKQQKQLEQQSRMMIGVGLMYVAMGAMAAFALAKIMGMSTEGSQYMEKFSQTAEGAAQSVGTAIFQTLKPALDLVSGALKIIAENKALAMLIANMAVLATVMLLAQGIMKLVTGALIRMQMQALATGTVGLKALTASFFTVNLSAQGLLVTMQKIFLIFYIFYAIATALSDALGGPLQAALVMLIPLLGIVAAMLWAGASAMSVLTFGAAAAAGIGGMIALQATAPQFQTGTRLVRRDTPAILHEGEMVTRARDIPEMASSKPSVTHMPVTIDMRGAIIQTKADKEELKPFILRTIRDANRAKE